LALALPHACLCQRARSSGRATRVRDAFALSPRAGHWPQQRNLNLHASSCLQKPGRRSQRLAVINDMHARTLDPSSQRMLTTDGRVNPSRIHDSPDELLVHGHYSSGLQQRPRLAARRAPPHGKAAGGGGRRGHAAEDVEEVVLVAGKRDGPGGRREAVLVLRLLQQLPERRVAEVRQRHHEPPGGAGAGLHAHRHVPRRNRIRARTRGAGGEAGGGCGRGVVAAGPPPPPPHGAAQPREGRDRRDRQLAHASCLVRRSGSSELGTGMDTRRRRRAHGGLDRGRGRHGVEGRVALARSFAPSFVLGGG
jgi:hypothetical protein